MNNVRFSVIIPVYNSSSTIRATMNSVIQQSYKDYEIIVVDDGSQDESLNICMEYIEKVNISVYSKKNEGVSSARNYGLEKAQGDYILFLDSDDQLDKDCLSNVDSTIDEFKTDAILFGYEKIRGELSKEYNCITGVHMFPDLINSNRISLNIAGFVFHRNLLVSQNLKFCNLKIGEDQIFFMDLFYDNVKIACIPIPFYKYLDNVQSVSHHQKATDIELAFHKFNDSKYSLIYKNYVELKKVQLVIDYIRTKDYKYANAVLMSRKLYHFRAKSAELKFEVFSLILQHIPSLVIPILRIFYKYSIIRYHK